MTPEAMTEAEVVEAIRLKHLKEPWVEGQLDGMFYAPHWEQAWIDRGFSGTLIYAHVPVTITKDGKPWDEISVRVYPPARLMRRLIARFPRPDNWPTIESFLSQESSMSDPITNANTEARVSLLEATVKNLAAFVASLPQSEIKPLPGIDLWQYHQELWKQVHGDKSAGYDLSRYEYYTNPAFAAQVANNEDFKLWTAAQAANIVPDSPAGLFLLLYLSGEGYEHAEKVVGGENGKRFVSWLLAYRGYPAPR